MIRLDTLNSVLKTKWNGMDKSEKQKFISKFIDTIEIKKDSKGNLILEKINFRNGFIKELLKFYNAGIIDVGVLLKTPIQKGKTVLGQPGIEQPKSDREFVLLNFLSDTGYGTSNLKSFEYDLLSPYLDFADKHEASKVFDLYMNLKSRFH